MLKKLYAVSLDMWFSEHLERNKLGAKGQAGFMRDYQTIYHIFTLLAIIEEAGQCSSEVFSCFVDFWKNLDLDYLPRHSGFSDIDISNPLVITIMRLCKVGFGRLCTSQGLSRGVPSHQPCLGFTFCEIET